MAQTAVDTDALIVANQKAFQLNLFATAIHICGYKELTNHTHREMVDCLENDSLNKLIVMPRGTFKTSLGVVAYAIWLIIRNPNVRILIDSATWTLCRNSLREIKAHIHGDIFQAAFPGWTLTLDNQDEIIISTRTHAKKEPTITASSIGSTKTGNHYDVIIADDLNNEENSMKPELAEKVVQHYRYYTSLLDPGGSLVVMGTRYSELDLIGHILRTEVDGNNP